MRNNNNHISYTSIRRIGAVNQSAFEVTWADVTVINYFTGSNYKRVSADKYDTSWCDEESANPTEIKFEDDTAIVCFR